MNLYIRNTAAKRHCAPCRGAFMRTVAAFVAAFLTCVVSMGREARQYDSRFYKQLAGMSVRDIYAKALTAITAHHEDSAFAYYTAIANRYNVNMTDSDKRVSIEAMTNVGAIAYYHLQDYNLSYSYLVKALKAAQEEKLDYIKPYIYVNLSDIHILFGDSVMRNRLCRKAFYEGKRLGDHYIYRQALLELISTQSMSGNFDAIKDELDDFGRNRLPENAHLRKYTDYVYHGVTAYARGRYTDCVASLDSASALIGMSNLDALYKIIPDMVAAKALAATGRYADAITRLKPYATDGMYQNARNYTFRALSDLYLRVGKADSAREYKVKSLLINDSALNYNEYMALRDIERRYLPADVIGDGSMFSLHGRLGRMTAAAVVLLVVVAGAMMWRYRHRRYSAGKSRKGGGTVATAGDALIHAPQDEKHDDKTLQLADAIKQYMETSGDIYDPDFSLDRLAAGVGAHTRTVSRAVNEVFGINFSTMLSNYRVNEACRRLSSPDYANVTIQAIAADVGFKSRSNFIAVFRRQTGMTPNEYQKKSVSKNTSD